MESEFYFWMIFDGDYNKPLEGSLLTNQYKGKYPSFFFVAQMIW